MSASDTFVLETLLTLCLLLFAAKIGGEIARRFDIAAVVGELLAGIILAPTLIGGLHVFGMQLIIVNDAVQMFAELGAVMLLFLVGLETRFADFTKSGLVSTAVAIGGVVVPFILGYTLVILWGYPSKEALLVGAALTATSIAITVKVLKDIGKSNTSESRILIGAAVIDDVLGLIVLAIVLGLLGGEELNLVDIGYRRGKSHRLLACPDLAGRVRGGKAYKQAMPSQGVPEIHRLRGDITWPGIARNPLHIEV